MDKGLRITWYKHTVYVSVSDESEKCGPMSCACSITALTNGAIRVVREQKVGCPYAHPTERRLARYGNDPKPFQIRYRTVVRQNSLSLEVTIVQVDAPLGIRHGRT